MNEEKVSEATEVYVTASIDDTHEMYVQVRHPKAYHDRKIRFKMGNSINVAFYCAVLDALELCVQKGDKKIHIITNSDMVVNQMNGKWWIKEGTLYYRFAVKCETLVDLMTKAGYTITFEFRHYKSIAKKFQAVDFSWDQLNEDIIERDIDKLSKN